MLKDSVICITGGTGSLGNALVPVLAAVKPKKIIIVSRDENKQHHMAAKFSGIDCLRFILGDVRDTDRIKQVFSGVDVVIHAAALKHIPKVEYNPTEAIKTNVIGTMNVVEACLASSVKKAVLISTDKAVAPVNLYGSTKLSGEKLFLAANAYNETIFSVVRYGNVLASRGSVIETFIKLKDEGVTEFPITDERMTRFWITLEEACNLVLTAIESDKPQVHIPDIPSMKITDVARTISPNCTFKITGIRPGEKLHESLSDGYDSNTNEWWMTKEELRRKLCLNE